MQPMNPLEPGRHPREIEVPVITDPPDPGTPKVPDLPPPMPDPPEVVGLDYGTDERRYHAEGWEPASWQPPLGYGAEQR